MKVWLVGVVAVVAVGTAVMVAVRTFGGTRPSQRAAVELPREKIDTPGRNVIVPVLVSDVEGRVTQAVTRAASMGLPTQAREALVSSVSEAAAAYLSADKDRVGLYFAMHGVVVPAEWHDAALVDTTGWAHYSEMVGSSVFNLDAIELTPRPTQPLKPPAGRLNTTAVRGDGRDGVTEHGLENFAGVTLIVPGAFRSPGGVEFEGALTLGFVWDAGARIWVLCETGWRGVPVGPSVPPPPL